MPSSEVGASTRVVRILFEGVRELIRVGAILFIGWTVGYTLFYDMWVFALFATDDWVDLIEMGVAGLWLPAVLLAAMEVGDGDA